MTSIYQQILRLRDNVVAVLIEPGNMEGVIFDRENARNLVTVLTEWANFHAEIERVPMHMQVPALPPVPGSADSRIVHLDEFRGQLLADAEIKGRA